MKHLLEQPIQGIIGEQKFKTSIQWRNGIFVTDEPEKIGGQDLGPDPFTLLLSSLVACTLATLRMYIAHKGLDIPEITVRANMGQKITGGTGEIVTVMERSIDFGDTPIDATLQERLIRIAENCPVSKMLKGNITINTTVD